jgi:hypothetical protein
MTRACILALFLTTLARAGKPPTDEPVLVISRAYPIDTLTGNANGRWDAGEQVQLYLVLRNDGSSSASDVTGDLSTIDPLLSIQQPHTFFGSIEPGDSMTSLTPLLTTCQSSTPPGHWGVFAAAISCLETTFVAPCSVQIAVSSNSDPIPDGPRVPPLYWAYDDNDSNWAEHPDYDWVEVNTLGTRLSFGHNDQVQAIELPDWFGELRFYGAAYESLVVSADGWVACGSDTTRDYSNTGLPDSTAPRAMIALNWDDLRPFNAESAWGGVYIHADSANHRLVIEYDSVAYYRDRNRRQKFELIVYDSTLRSATGDNVFVAQYLNGIWDSSATIGMQDPSRTIGIEYVFNGVYNPLALPMSPGRVIRYVTQPPTGVVEKGLTPDLPRLTLRLSPNPSRVGFAISCDRMLAEVVVHDVSGRLVRQLVTSSFHPSIPSSLCWDGCDEQGRRCNPGIYLVSARSGDRVAAQKAILLR